MIGGAAQQRLVSPLVKMRAEGLDGGIDMLAVNFLLYLVFRVSAQRCGKL